MWQPYADAFGLIMCVAVVRRGRHGGSREWRCSGSGGVIASVFQWNAAQDEGIEALGGLACSPGDAAQQDGAEERVVEGPVEVAER